MTDEKYRAGNHRRVISEQQPSYRPGNGDQDSVDSSTSFGLRHSYLRMGIRSIASCAHALHWLRDAGAANVEGAIKHNVSR